jgi:hypothetical protein
MGPISLPLPISRVPVVAEIRWRNCFVDRNVR